MRQRLSSHNRHTHVSRFYFGIGKRVPAMADTAPVRVMPTPYMNMYELYEKNKTRRAPTLITSDSVLHSAHVLFDYTLRAAKVQHFDATVRLLTEKWRMPRRAGTAAGAGAGTRQPSSATRRWATTGWPPTSGWRANCSRPRWTSPAECAPAGGAGAAAHPGARPDGPLPDHGGDGRLHAIRAARALYAQ